MDCFECDGLHDEKLLRSCEEFDSLSENRLISFDQQAISICKFAQIKEKLQSDVNKKLIVQRSELIVSKKIENWV